jgi:hypothetical protein
MRLSASGIVLLLSVVIASPVPAQDTASSFPSLTGWVFAEDKTVYTPDNLWDIIDGAADLFLEYGFIDLHIGRYEKGEDSEIRSEVYKFDSETDAFGMYSQERNPEYAFIDIGTQAYREDGVLNFLAGKYYVKIMTRLHGHEALDAMTAIAEGMESRLHQRTALPGILNFLPAQQKHLNSEQYVATNFLGYSFFHHAIVARYGAGTPFRVFVVAADSVSAAESAFGEFVKSSPGGISDAGTVERYSVRDRYNGAVEIFRKGNFIGGTVGLDDRGLATVYINEIIKRIETIPFNDRISK